MSIYEGRSPAGQRALASLRATFQRAGFYAEKERHTEGSLRVYPEKRGRYPLLNPSIGSPRSRYSIPVRASSVVCPVYSDHDDSITRVLRDLAPIAGCQFIVAPPRRRKTKYSLHGHFLIPITAGAAARPDAIHWDALESTLAELHLRLTEGLFRVGSRTVGGWA